ncbi:hypothetical protein BXY66_0368 [Shimia isoporae]|uniref:Cupin domain n=1 Tax=Shimia isoporae TaxID=647720 RepID=A0A4R1NKY5_9RHOB|nr:hypothetical protein [Shimia isoporae]TCL08331.1 hypothetical protein BXY66_0368 [Shimia isoporae]
MPKLYMSASTGTSQPQEDQKCTYLFSAYWIAKGRAEASGNTIERGAGALLKSGETISFTGSTKTDWVRFDLFHGAAPADAKLDAPIVLPDQPTDSAVLLRLDQVTFPADGVAYRHVHPGAGIRFLVNGKLRIIGDAHQETATPGHAWFENANSPVRAEADPTQRVTSFVRFMVLPAIYLGKPTIQVLDPKEQAMPRVQVTKRHVDSLAYF